MICSYKCYWHPQLDFNWGRCNSIDLHDLFCLVAVEEVVLKICLFLAVLCRLLNNYAVPPKSSKAGAGKLYRALKVKQFGLKQKYVHYISRFFLPVLLMCKQLTLHTPRDIFLLTIYRTDFIIYVNYMLYKFNISFLIITQTIISFLLLSCSNLKGEV